MAASIEEGCNLHSRQRHTGTPVSAPSESHMRGNIGSMQDELIGVVKHLGVPVGRRVGHGDGFRRLDGLALDRHILGSGSGESAVGGIQPQKLFHGRRDKRLVIAELLLEGLVLGQVLADGADEDGRRHHTDD